MTRTVQRLERAGYVRRVPDPDDRRATRVEPTPASLVLRVDVPHGTWARSGRAPRIHSRPRATPSGRSWIWQGASSTTAAPVAVGLSARGAH
ncbi:MarR family winged helix-turn-helix transcriptional regulator [Micromonospora tulbaghiae]